MHRSISLSRPFSCTMLLVILAVGACGPIERQALVAVTPLPSAPTALSPAPTDTPDPVASAAIAATPTLLAIDLPVGSAAAIALATDVAMQPEMVNPLVFDESPIPVAFDEFYEGFHIRTGLVLSDKLRSLDGKAVVIEGYMAPPLKPQLDWFVLTRIRLEFCPFCSSTADWPDDIALIYLSDATMVSTQQPLRVQGQMEIGPAVDPETGMVSIVRIYADQIEQLAGQPVPAVALAGGRP